MKLEDLPGDVCAHCGLDMPEGMRTDAIFCCRTCRDASYRALLTAARLVEKRGRSCVRCGDAIPETKHRNAIFCSYRCRTREQAKRRRAADPERHRAAHRAWRARKRAARTEAGELAGKSTPLQ